MFEEIRSHRQVSLCHRVHEEFWGSGAGLATSRGLMFTHFISVGGFGFQLCVPVQLSFPYILHVYYLLVGVTTFAAVNQSKAKGTYIEFEAPFRTDAEGSHQSMKLYAVVDFNDPNEKKVNRTHVCRGLPMFCQVRPSPTCILTVVGLGV